MDNMLNGAVGMLLVLFIGIAFYAIAVNFPVMAVRFVAQRFLRIAIDGNLFKACAIGTILGILGFGLLGSADAPLLALAAFFFGCWPPLIMFVQKRDASNALVALDHKEAAILSAGSFLTILVVMMVFALAINLFMVAGFTGYFFSAWRGPEIFSF